jgi:ribosomal protein L37AE/L43A
MSNGTVDKNNIHDIHDKIKSILLIKADKASETIDYGYYITRVWDFFKHIPSNKGGSILDMFRQNKFVKIDLKLLLEYFNIAREYIPNLRIEQNQNIICPSCSSVNVSEQTDGEVYCEQCGFIYDNRLPGMKDIECINTCKSYYSLKVNLLRTIHRYEGKKSFISQSDMDLITSEIKHRKFDIAELRVEHLSTILKDLKMSKFYDDVRTIYNIIMGNDYGKIKISEYIPQILKLHEDLEYAYNYVKNPERINSLNVHYKLFKLLQLCGVDCAISDFYTH